MAKDEGERLRSRKAQPPIFRLYLFFILQIAFASNDRQKKGMTALFRA